MLTSNLDGYPNSLRFSLGITHRLLVYARNASGVPETKTIIVNLHTAPPDGDNSMNRVHDVVYNGVIAISWIKSTLHSYTSVYACNMDESGLIRIYSSWLKIKGSTVYTSILMVTESRAKIDIMLPYTFPNIVSGMLTLKDRSGRT